MALTSRGELGAVPEELRLSGAVPEDAVFFDSNAALKPVVDLARQAHRTPLISAIVYAELLRIKPTPIGARNLEQNLVDRGLRVVGFDLESGRHFLETCVACQFDVPPLLAAGEDKRRCFDRLRFDLAILASAYRHRRLLVTDNTRDFQNFPFGDYWTTSSAFSADPSKRPQPAR